MNSMNLLEIIGEAPEEYLLDAKKVPKRKTTPIRWGTLAASVVALVIIISLLSNNSMENRIEGVENHDEQFKNKLDSEETEQSVAIYVVKNGRTVAENAIANTSDEAFNAWKTNNGIGEEVKLLSDEIEIPYDVDEAEETKEEMQQAAVSESLEEGEDILVIHISKEIKNYYEETEKEILLKSLQQTMTEFYGLTYEQCEIVFE